jgi:uncharacterized membrane protein
MKINWKQKLTSRKFWAAVIGFVTALLIAFGVNNLTVEQVVSVVSAMSVLIAYIIGEGLVDAKRENGETSNGDMQITMTPKGFYDTEGGNDE